jgi:hypothetical protein
MLRNLAIAFTAVAVLAMAAGVQAQQRQGQGQGQGQGRRGMMGGGMGGGMGVQGLLQNEKVAKEIELTAEQKEKLQAVAKEVQESFQSMRSEMQGLSQEERTKKMQEAMEKTQKKVEGVLLPHQLKRIKEIQLQVQGIRALSNPEVVKELGLSSDQQEKIKTVNDDARKNRPQFTPGQRPSQEDMDKMQKSMKVTETKLLDVLTAEQKEKLEKMKGEKFDTTGLRGGFGGGMGGNRRGNRAGGGNGGGGAGPVN